jgi:hypothetical protein
MLKMNHKQAIALTIQTFRENWQGKFTVSDVLLPYWEEGLSQFPVSAIQAATSQVINTMGAFPPSLGEFRAVVIALTNPEANERNASA